MRDIKFFNHLSDEQLAQFIDFCTPEVFVESSVIFELASDTTLHSLLSFYVVLEGEVQLITPNSTKCKVQRNGLFGTLGSLRFAKRAHRAIALKPCLILKLPYAVHSTIIAPACLPTPSRMISSWNSPASTNSPLSELKGPFSCYFFL